MVTGLHLHASRLIAMDLVDVGRLDAHVEMQIVFLRHDLERDFARLQDTAHGVEDELVDDPRRGRPDLGPAELVLSGQQPFGGLALLGLNVTQHRRDFGLQVLAQLRNLQFDLGEFVA